MQTRGAPFRRAAHHHKQFQPASAPPSATRVLYIRLPLGMESTPRLLLFLRKLVSFFSKRWDQSARLLWHIFAFVRSRISLQNPKKRDEVPRDIEYRPTKPPTTAICASQFPPPLSPIAGGDTPIASPTPISIQVRHPTILNPADTVYETHDDHSSEHLGVDGYFLEGSRPILRSPDSVRHHHAEPESIHTTTPPHREDNTSNSPVIPSRPPSRPSQYSYRSPSQYSHRPPSRLSYRSPSYLDGAEVAARGYLNAPPSLARSTPAPSAHAPSVAGSAPSQVHHASRPSSRVRMPWPIRDTSRHEVRPSTPTSTRQSVHNAPAVLPRPESRASGSIHRDRPSTAVSSGSVSLAPPKERLRPMIGIDRYNKQKQVVVQKVINSHISSPVTTQFVR